MVRSVAVVLSLVFSSVVGAGCVTEDDPCQARGGAPGFCGGGTWLNSPPLDASILEQKVVLVDFWTYSCINCIRTLPHLTSWYEAYAPHGFVIIGVHSPEFEFEKKVGNVQQAVLDFGIDYPVVQDNEFNIWRAYENRYWPTHYLIADGKIQDVHIGEGGYAKTEAAIRTLLEKKGADLPPPLEDGTLRATGADDVTRELYAGTWRQSDTLGDGPYKPGQDVSHDLADHRNRDRIYLDGTWHHGHEALTSRDAGIISLQFRAGAANIVLSSDRVGCAAVTLDGGPVPAGLRGGDVRDRGDSTCIDLDGSRSYDLYSGPVATHEVQLHVPADVELYTFAFSRYERGMTP